MGAFTLNNNGVRPSLDGDELGGRDIMIAYKSYMDKGSQSIVNEVN